MLGRMVFWILMLFAVPACAAETRVTLTLFHHQFAPAIVHVPANELITVVLVNADSERAEFASASLKSKRVVAGHASGTMRWRPLAPGRYIYVEEFHTETARGIVIAE